ncbi:MAG: outer membrane beta-barrel protein [Candidatus Latescibacterota bacterium]|jgi:hypothetical protein
MDGARLLSRLAPSILVCALLAGPTFGQAKFGAAAGVNWSSLGDVDFGSVDAAYDSKTGWHLGAFADVNFLFLALKPGIYYVNAGPLLEDPDYSNGGPGIGDELESFNYTYVSVPVDVLLQLPLVVASPYLFLGPELKFNTTSSDAEEISDQLESTVLAGNLGLGVKLNLGSITLYPELRYAFDISAIFGDTIVVGGQEFSTEDYKSNQVFARIGVGF